MYERRAMERDIAVGGRLQSVPEAGDMAGRSGPSERRRRQLSEAEETGPVPSEEQRRCEAEAAGEV